MPPHTLPAQRIDAAGRAHVDLRAVFALAAPLIANSTVQAVLNLTDTWFVGRISTEAVAAVGSVYWLVIVVNMLLGGMRLAVQTVVAQSYGGRRYVRSGQAVWTSLWGVLFAAPLYFAVAAAGHWIVKPFGLSLAVQDMAASFWFPRVAGSVFGLATFSLLGFFNGIGRPRVTLLVTIVMTASNVFLNQLFIFDWHMGIAGSGLASSVAEALGFVFALGVFLNARHRRQFRSHLTWRLHGPRLLKQFLLGFPMGLLYAADLIGMAFFQIMQVRLGAAEGAATQIAGMLTSIAYMPGVGIALAGTTLVGQSIGAGDRAWAMRVGTRVIAVAAFYMGGIGILTALAGPWLLPLFTSSHDAQSVAVTGIGVQVLWFAAAYQFFDGLNLGSGFCLRGAGDAIVPAVLVLVLSWLIFVPLAHMMTFAPGQGWVDWLPQLGWGVLGGWAAIVVYVLLLGTTLFIRWRSGAWQRIRL